MSDSVLAVTAIIIALVSLFWNLLGRPAPLSPTNLRRFGVKLKNVPAEWRLRCCKRRAARRERERRMEEELLRRERTVTEAKLKGTLRRAVLRLHTMESGSVSYDVPEWKSQKALCKDAVFGIVQYMDYQFSSTGINWDSIACTNYEADTIIFQITKSRWHKRALQLYILIHPSPSLTNNQYGWSEMFGGSATVLSTPLTAEDMMKLSWEFPDEWETWETKRIPGRSLPELMTPNEERARRVTDWVPTSPFASTKLPE